MTPQTKLFQFLEKKKEELYKLENQNKSLHIVKPQLILIKEIYKIFNFNYLKIAFIQKKEEKLWNQYFKILRQAPDYELKVLSGLNHLNKTKFLYNRLKKYDVLRVGGMSYFLGKQA